ncbi:MAG: hypothetical protein SPF22_07785 [Candidatus Onthovivens sp.]|nr:hypothetical protein [Candidatus Onthovivens sp.]
MTNQHVNIYVGVTNRVKPQWGYAGYVGQSSTFKYPIPFPNNILMGLCIPWYSGILAMYNHNPSIGSLTKSSCICYMKDQFSGNWEILVIGY